ncbi:MULTISPECIES: fumarate/nitrate reduction transcriptional regulator Fnr [Chromohalobacter]|uniref:Transcriptional regulator FNR n=3 Tax=Chromohalobacter TaxID=42054 RepID=A0A1Q8TFR4_9GAMM|nr:MULTISPECIES: fumarate/nitrate reduction transcriptional regulator Fnr [Chromohalobacter]MCK2042712.1 fumarate/nitrate reduction transcriptional regulator Fnr [Chromohalobacter moromii]MCK2045387.1 fumarate/nitrate reduction transcriptional regulator Fnr [Chromohalobacter moromii]MCT8504946.1 fumarate/nitrate reduction transcriptional regulator Fnr [Chromohalobacter moromii]MCT8514768.1 fumarate/nitrate reduction transcriptional regulator Fnr [Chromohalobacter sp. TMW 2.2271]MDV6317727.1 fu
MTRIATLSESRDSCHNCRLRTLCLPDNLPKEDIGKLEGIVQRRKPVSRGGYLFQAGQRFNSIYAVRTGAVKTSTLMANGDEHISGFHLPGEVIGLDAIVSRDHPSSAIALETASICEIPYAELETLSERTPALQHRLMRIMSRELLAEQSTNHLLSRRSAEQRLAVVLLKFSERFADRGLSALRFRLPMSRLDLGNYLGLVPETMSRTFRRLEEQGLVSIAGKEIEIVDSGAMKALAFGAEGSQTART